MSACFSLLREVICESNVIGILFSRVIRPVRLCVEVMSTCVLVNTS